MRKDLIKGFEKIRDLQYKIPLFFDDKFYNCSIKNTLLKSFLEENGYLVNFRVCNFYWEDLNLPENILKIQHTKKSMHVYLEVENDGKKIILDSSFDIGLKYIFEIPVWDGINSTIICVKEISKFSLEESKEIMEDLDIEKIKEHLEYNREFYKKINEYLEESRKNNFNTACQQLVLISGNNKIVKYFRGF